MTEQQVIPMTEQNVIPMTEQLVIPVEFWLNQSPKLAIPWFAMVNPITHHLDEYYASYNDSGREIWHLDQGEDQ
jgi:hypothetical protein